MIIKVCGMREPENIRAIEQAGADWMGFIFFPQSARYVSHRPEYLPEQCHRIGVFVNESSENILLKAQEFGLQPYPVAWQGNTGTMSQIKSNRTGSH